MQCNACHRTATHILKLGFAQEKPAMQNIARLVFTFETTGGYCLTCVGRIERRTREGFYDEVVNPPMRAEVSMLFAVRGWGEPSWNETSVEFVKMDDRDKALLAASAEGMTGKPV